MRFLKKISNSLFSTSAAGLYLILMAASIGTATFVENDYGTSSAQKIIFKTSWFELLLVLFGITLIANIIRFRMVQQKKWTILTFHSAMVIIILGAGVTRYFGSEGMMGIREGDASNTFLSSNTYLQFEAIQNGRKYRFDEPVLFAALGDNHLKKSYRLGNEDIEVEVLDFMPNPTETIVEDEAAGVPVLKIVIGGANGREEFPVRPARFARIPASPAGSACETGNLKADQSAKGCRLATLSARAAIPLLDRATARRKSAPACKALAACRKAPKPGRPPPSCPCRSPASRHFPSHTLRSRERDFASLPIARRCRRTHCCTRRPQKTTPRRTLEDLHRRSPCKYHNSRKIQYKTDRSLAHSSWTHQRERQWQPPGERSYA